jgi:hypothetical protein
MLASVLLGPIRFNLVHKFLHAALLLALDLGITTLARSRVEEVIYLLRGYL